MYQGDFDGFHSRPPRRRPHEERHGARHLFGEVLRTNTAMRELARKAGFSIVSPFTDARLVEIVKDLSLTPAAPMCAEQFAALSSIAA